MSVVQTRDETSLCYMRVDDAGWFTSSPTFENLRRLIGSAEVELVIPIFPTVFTPEDALAPYYNALRDNVKAGDKVLIVGCGSGADAWAAWLRARTTIYAIDINPTAILNTYATARMGGFRVRPLCGDIRSLALPEDFAGFDVVAAMLPFLGRSRTPMEQVHYHDGDDGTVTAALMELLPSLLKKGGRAVVAGTDETAGYITLPAKKTGEMVYVLGASL